MNRRKQTIAGDFGSVVADLYEKYKGKDGGVYNPCKILRVILADDNALGNLAMRSMIEQAGKFQIFSFYNGVDVTATEGITIF